MKIILQICVLLIIIIEKQTINACQGPYLNFHMSDCTNAQMSGVLCEKNTIEFFSLSCGKCGSNETEVEDFENVVCDCQEVIYCSVFELHEDCNSTTLFLDFSFNIPSLDQLQCDIQPLDSQQNIPDIVILNQTNTQLIIEILNDFDFGTYKTICFIQPPDKVVPPIITEWEIVDVNPSEVVVDSKLKLLLTVVEQNGVKSPFTWCFVNTPDSNVEVYSTSWISNTQIECIGFKSLVPGLHKISLNSGMTSSTFEKSVTVKVNSKHPIAQRAEYSPDLEAIFIYFDENIELHSSCKNVFSKETLKFFEKSVNCSTKGNVLVVKTSPQTEFVSNVGIISKNKICRAGSQGGKFCLPALPANLPIMKPKIMGPNLSLGIKSDCERNPKEKRLSIKVVPWKYMRFPTRNQTIQTKTRGKTQRKNLILWRTMRQIQRKLSSRNLQIDPMEVAPLLEDKSLLDNILNEEEYNSDSTASVSVSVQSSPSTSSVLAEADVSFCKDSLRLFRYKWIVNGQDSTEDGKLLSVKDLTPGKHIFKCLIVDYNSTEVLGQGWATAEVPISSEKIIITPSEITTRGGDDITLHAVTVTSASVTWSCKSAAGKPCTTVNQALISEVIDLNSQNVSIPAQTLPFGEYIWTAENARGSNEAKIIIKPGNVSIGVEPQSLFVKPSQEVVLRGNIKQIQRNCYAWWSSVREKGCGYLQLRDVERNEEISPDVEEIPLVISSEDWKNAQPDTLYMFKLQVLCPDNEKGSLDYVKVPLRLTNPPHLSTLTVEPSKGKAMVTEFTVVGPEADASVDEYPLVYEWSYVDSCNLEVPLKRGAFSSSYTTYLPPGDLKIIVKVCDGKKICTTASSSVIIVIQESQFPTENFQNSLTQIQYLTTSGEHLEGFGLAITVLKSLALLAETEIREKVYSTLEEVILFKTNDLIMKSLSNSKAVESSIEFYERAIGVAKYFRKGSNITVHLEEFKTKILNMKKKYKL